MPIEVTVRLVPYKSAEVFAETRATAQRYRKDIEAYVRYLNTRMRCKSNNTTQEAARSDIGARRAHRSMRTACMPSITDACTDDHLHPSRCCESTSQRWR